MAMRKPAPNELYCLMALIRLRAAPTVIISRGSKQVGVGLVLGPADAAAQLIEIGQAEPVRAVDDDGVRVRNIEAALDDRRADQHVDLAGNETRHDLFQFVRVHLAVAEFDARLRTKLGDPIAHSLDRLHAIVQEVNLALPLELAIDRVANDSLVVSANDRLDRQAIERRRFDRGHVFHAHERKIKRARNRRGGEREHIHQFEQLLELLLVQHAEALLLVDHDQAEVLENDVAGNEPMGADDDVDAAFAQELQDFALFARASGNG